MDFKMVRRFCKMVTLEKKVKALEMYDTKPYCIVEETFGVSRDKVLKFVNRKADLFEKYSANTPNHS